MTGTKSFTRIAASTAFGSAFHDEEIPSILHWPSRACNPCSPGRFPPRQRPCRSATRCPALRIQRRIMPAAAAGGDAPGDHRGGGNGRLKADLRPR